MEVVSVAIAESDTGVEAFEFLGAGKEHGDSATGDCWSFLFCSIDVLGHGM